MSEALKKARDALEQIKESIECNAITHGDMHQLDSALAAIDAEAKPVVRMLTDEEVLGAVEDAERSHYRWSNGVRGQQLMPQDSPRFHLVMAGAAKVLSVNGLTIGEQG